MYKCRKKFTCGLSSRRRVTRSSLNQKSDATYPLTYKTGSLWVLRRYCSRLILASVAVESAWDPCGSHMSAPQSSTFYLLSSHLNPRLQVASDRRRESEEGGAQRERRAAVGSGTHWRQRCSLAKTTMLSRSKMRKQRQRSLTKMPRGSSTGSSTPGHPQAEVLGMR